MGDLHAMNSRPDQYWNNDCINDLVLLWRPPVVLSIPSFKIAIGKFTWYLIEIRHFLFCGKWVQQSVILLTDNESMFQDGANSYCRWLK